MDINEYHAALQILNQADYKLSGVHLHSGSNLSSPELIVNSLKMYENIITESIRKDRDFWVDIGSGFPANSCKNRCCFTDEKVFPFEIARYYKEIGIEPGRCLVEDYGSLVTSVEDIRTRDCETLVLLDPGIHLVRSIGT